MIYSFDLVLDLMKNRVVSPTLFLFWFGYLTFVKGVQKSISKIYLIRVNYNLEFNEKVKYDPFELFHVYTVQPTTSTISRHRIRCNNNDPKSVQIPNNIIWELFAACCTHNVRNSLLTAHKMTWAMKFMCVHIRITYIWHASVRLATLNFIILHTSYCPLMFY